MPQMRRDRGRIGRAHRFMIVATCVAASSVLPASLGDGVEVRPRPTAPRRPDLWLIWEGSLVMVLFAGRRVPERNQHLGNIGQRNPMIDRDMNQDALRHGQWEKT